ncbi:sodium:solute symporter family protein [bacterium]|nr:sodium:solute symporter family protein [bacterium]
MIVLIVMMAYLVFTLFIGTLAGFTGINSLDEYLNASRSLGMVTTYFLLGASVFSAFAFLGCPGMAYGQGVACLYVLAFSATGLWGMYLFGPRIMALGRRFGYSTQCELLGGRFQSRALSVLIATATSIAFVIYIAVQMKGCGYIFQTMTGGKVSFWQGALISYGVVIVYVFWGGVRGVAWTTVLQGAFMIVIAWFLGIYVPAKLYGGWEPMFREIARVRPDLLVIGTKGSTVTMGSISSNILISFLGFMMWPHLFIRPFNVRDLGTMRRTVLIYPTFALMLVPVMIVGFAGIVKYPLATSGIKPDQILPYIAMQLGFSPVLLGLIGAGALAAAMSTQAAITQAAAVSFAKDLYGNVVRREQTPGATMWIVRLAVIVFGAISILVAAYPGTLVLMMLTAYGSILQILPIVVAALYWKRATTAGVLSGFIAGVIVIFVLQVAIMAKWLSKTDLLDLDPSLYGLALNALVMVAVSLATPAQDSTHAGKFVDVAISEREM